MKNLVIIIILSTLCFQLFSAETIQNNTNNYFISTGFDLIKLKDTDFKLGKKNDWEIKLSYQLQSKPYYEHNTTTEVANSSLFYQLDSLGDYNWTIESNIGLLRSSQKYDNRNVAEFSLEYNKVFYERVFSKSLINLYSGFGTEFEYIYTKYHTYTEQIGVETNIAFEEGIDYYGDFWHSDSIIIVEDDISTVKDLEIYFNIPLGIKIENDIPLLKTHNIFLELDLTLLNFIFYLSNFNSNDINSRVNNLGHDRNYKDIDLLISSPKLDVNLKYYF